MDTSIRSGRSLLFVLAGTGTLVAVLSTLLFTSRTFATDWSNDLWLVSEQMRNINALGHPSYFLTSNMGVFQPQFLFYGGTLFALVGYAAALGGHPLAAYLVTFSMAVVTAYAGWCWLARQIGVRGWRMQVPAVLFVTSSYYVSNLYGRGDFAETVATSMIPAVAASGLWLARAPRWRPLPLVIFVMSVAIMTGSHPVTLVWAATFLGGLVVLLKASTTGTRSVSWRRMTELAGTALLALCLNGWSLLPTVAYKNDLLIDTDRAVTQLWYSTPGALFAVARDAVTPAWISGSVQAQLPVLALVWALVAVVVLRDRFGLVRLRAATSLGLLFVVVVVLAGSGSTILGSLPTPWTNLQFPYRLVTYGTLAVCGLVALGLSVLEGAPSRTRAWLSIGIAAVCVVSIGAGMKQIWSTPSFVFTDRSQILGVAGVAPASYYPGLTYSDVSAPVVTPTLTRFYAGSPLRKVHAIDFPYASIKSRMSIRVRVPKSGTVLTNITTGPYLVKLTGAVPVGRTPIEPGGALGQTFMVVRLTGRPGTVQTVTATTAASAPLRLGLWLSAAAGACVLALLLTVWRAAFVGRRSRAAATPPPDL